VKARLLEINLRNLKEGRRSKERRKELLVNELMPATYVVQTNIMGLLDRKETEFIIPSSDLYMKQLQL